MVRLRESGLFAFVREVHCHAETTAAAEAVIDLAHSLGGPTAIFEGRAPELDETMDALTRIARERLPEAAADADRLHDPARHHSHRLTSRRRDRSVAHEMPRFATSGHAEHHATIAATSRRR